jgi:transposase-like protein
MVMDTFSAPHFRDDDAAREMLESILWPEGPVCPHCGVINHAYVTKRPGVFRCAEKGCRKDFSVTMNTVMERSHIALHKWMQAFHLLCSSKKGVSAHQLHRTLEITYEAAWFMAHRIREAMRSGGLAPLGGDGQIVEVDETYHRHAAEPPVSPQRKGRPYTKNRRNNRPIVALVERGGRVRAFHVPVADQAAVEKIVRENIARESRLHTDESHLYHNAADHFKAHKTVKHSAKEYARKDYVGHNKDKTEFYFENVHTNSAEGYFSIFKRGMRGIYQHCAEKKHLHRYLAEYDFRCNHRIRLGYNDGERAILAVKSAAGKRLTYRGPSQA